MRERWGDSASDRRALDNWITREPDPRDDDRYDVGDMTCERCDGTGILPCDNCSERGDHICCVGDGTLHFPIRCPCQRATRAVGKQEPEVF